MKASGADAFELDLQPTADLASGSDDGVVVFHDRLLSHTTNGAGLVEQHRYSELSRLDPAYWWAPGKIFDHHARDHPLRGEHKKHDDLRIVRLVDVLAEFPETPISLDLKRPGMAGKVAELLRRSDRVDDVVVASFSERRVLEYRRLVPEGISAPGVVGTSLFFAGSRAGASRNAAGHAVIAPPHKLGPLRVDKSFVHSAHQAGMAVNVWTINDVDVLDRVLHAGVDGVITDIPSQVKPLVQSFNDSLQ